MEDFFSDVDDVDESESSHSVEKEEDNYTKWSTWSRCTDCLQRRMKECISYRCEGSRIYEERQCKKSRCKKKSRKKNGFNIVHLNEVSQRKHNVILAGVRIDSDRSLWNSTIGRFWYA